MNDDPPLFRGQFCHATVPNRWYDCTTLASVRHGGRHGSQTLTDRIRERAYEIWVGSGCAHGAAEDHWLAAEREILDAPQTAAEREKS